MSPSLNAILIIAPLKTRTRYRINNALTVNIHIHIAKFEREHKSKWRLVENSGCHFHSYIYLTTSFKCTYTRCNTAQKSRKLSGALYTKPTFSVGNFTNFTCQMESFFQTRRHKLPISMVTQLRRQQNGNVHFVKMGLQIFSLQPV